MCFGNTKKPLAATVIATSVPKTDTTGVLTSNNVPKAGAGVIVTNNLLSSLGLTEIQLAVYNFFSKQIATQATDEQLEAALLAAYPAQTTVSRRRTDLVQKGVMRAAVVNGKKLTWKNKNNRAMTVWEIVPQYRNLLVQSARA